MKSRFFKAVLAIAPAICLSFAIGACDAHEHTFSEKWSFDENSHWHDADCGHDVTNGAGTHEMSNGVCKVCKYEDGSHKHTFEEKWSFDENKHWHEATCGHNEKDGAGAHDFSGDEGDCTVCGHNKMHFEETGEDGYKVTGHDDKNLQRIEIPATYRGKPVTAIGFKAFADFDKLAEITVPDSVTKIEEKAFLRTAYCKNSANWENGALYIGDCLIEGGADGAFTVKSGTRVIADYAFADCITLKEINLADSVEHIGSYAFRFCRNLTAVNAGSGLKNIGSYAFYCCTSLASFEFNGNIDEVIKGVGWNAFTAI